MSLNTRYYELVAAWLDSKYNGNTWFNKRIPEVEYYEDMGWGEYPFIKAIKPEHWNEFVAWCKKVGREKEIPTEDQRQTFISISGPCGLRFINERRRI